MNRQEIDEMERQFNDLLVILALMLACAAFALICLVVTL